MRRVDCGKSPGAIFQKQKLNHMLTEDELYEMALQFVKDSKTVNIDIAMYWFQHGAQAANAKNGEENSTLRAELYAKTVAFDGLKKLLGTEQDATTQHMENQALRAENERLRAALQALYDEQNGAPLSQREEDWFQAYRKAGDVLQKFSAAIEAAEIPA